jgi:hypothetical protein
MLRMDAFVLIVMTRGLSGLHGLRRTRLLDKLLRCFVEAYQRTRRIVRPLIDLQHIFHRRVVAKHAFGMTKAALAFGGMTQ